MIDDLKLKEIEITVRQLEAKEGEWFDREQERLVRGIIYVYEVIDRCSGRWKVKVRFSPQINKAVALISESDGASWQHNALTGKSMVFKQSTMPGKYYNELGISYCIEHQKRVKRKRVTNIEDIPEEILKILNPSEIVRYEEAVPSASPSPHRRKLVALVGENQPDVMALLLVLERIRPIFCSPNE